MKTIKTLKEYQDIVNEVKRTKQAVKVKVSMTNEELDKALTELNLDGIEVIVGSEYDEIKPL